jgi:hypothetical protein
MPSFHILARRPHRINRRGDSIFRYTENIHWTPLSYGRATTHNFQQTKELRKYPTIFIIWCIFRVQKSLKKAAFMS